MYLLLLLAGNYVIWSAHLGSPRYIGRNPAEWRELNITSLQEHLRPFNQDDHSGRNNKRSRVKSATESQKSTLMFAANATQ